MFTIDRSTFYLLFLAFGIFWVIVEGLIAFWMYKMYKLLDKYFKGDRK